MEVQLAIALLQRAESEFETRLAALVHRCGQQSVHRLRVSIRRTRALISSLRPWLDDRDADRCNADLQQIAIALGPARDLDVIARLLTRRITIEAGLDREQRALLRQKLADHVRQSRTRLRMALRTQKFRAVANAVVHMLRESSQTLGASDYSRSEWSARILRDVAKVERRARRAKTHDFHALRVHVKRCRYVLEALDRRTHSKPLQRLKQLHTVLGRWCDLRLVVRSLKRRGELCDVDATGVLRRAARALFKREGRRARQALAQQL